MITSRRLFMHEVAPRDGLQAEPNFVQTDRKVAFIDALSECGFAKIEITSFTSAKAIPQLSDAAVVAREIKRAPNTIYSALVPNRRGAEAAIEAGLDELNFVMSVSPSHNLANLKMSPDSSFAQIVDVASLAERSGVALNVSLSTVFGCPYEGPQSQDRVLHWARKYRDVGIERFTLCDTVGAADPVSVEQLVETVRDELPNCQFALHFHDTRGMALANVMAGVRGGIERFEGSVGGLGGCPYAPGATGNACSEDMVHMLEACGFDTGVALGALLEVSRGLPEIVGHSGNGHVVQASSGGAKETRSAVRHG